jgi:hypothetical protein
MTKSTGLTHTCLEQMQHGRRTIERSAEIADIGQLCDQ